MPNAKNEANSYWALAEVPCSHCAAQIQAGLAAFLCDGLITLIFVLCYGRRAHLALCWVVFFAAAVHCHLGLSRAATGHVV